MPRDMQNHVHHPVADNLSFLSASAQVPFRTLDCLKPLMLDHQGQIHLKTI